MSARNGFTLIEILVASAVLTIFIAAVFMITQTITQSLGEARVRSIGIQLAQDQLEMAHNLAYDHVGTLGGIPQGDLSQSKVITDQGVQFSVTTSVLYIDDPFDGVAPTDLLPTDYKRVRVSVTWTGPFTPKAPVVLMTDISPPGIETMVGAGTLSILVFNGQGQPVANAQVHIAASSLSPAISMDAFSDVNGQVLVPGAPICTGCYHITATKTGFTTDRTYGTDEVANPIKPHVTILQSRVTNVSFTIDQVSTFTISTTHSRASGYTPFAGVNLIITGTKVIGRTTTDDPVYKVNQTITTGGVGGTATLSNLEWDTYMISVPTGSSIDLAGSWPLNPISIVPGQSTNMTVVVDAASANSLLVQVENNASLPLDIAQVEIRKDAFVATNSTGIANKGDWSQAFFKNLNPGTYNLTINSANYETATDSVSINGDVIDKIIMSTITP